MNSLVSLGMVSSSILGGFLYFPPSVAAQTTLPGDNNLLSSLFRDGKQTSKVTAKGQASNKKTKKQKKSNKKKKKKKQQKKKVKKKAPPPKTLSKEELDDYIKEDNAFDQSSLRSYDVRMTESDYQYLLEDPAREEYVPCSVATDFNTPNEQEFSGLGCRHSTQHTAHSTQHTTHKA